MYIGTVLQPLVCMYSFFHMTISLSIGIELPMP